jgi:hypothetical protein
VVRVYYSRLHPFRTFQSSRNNTYPTDCQRSISISTLFNALKAVKVAGTAAVEPNVPMDKLLN